MRQYGAKKKGDNVEKERGAQSIVSSILNDKIKDSKWRT